MTSAPAAQLPAFAFQRLTSLSGVSIRRSNSGDILTFRFPLRAGEMPSLEKPLAADREDRRLFFSANSADRHHTAALDTPAAPLLPDHRNPCFAPLVLLLLAPISGRVRPLSASSLLT